MVSHSTPMWMVYYHDQTDQRFWVPYGPQRSLPIDNVAWLHLPNCGNYGNFGNYGGLNPELRNFFGRQSWVGAWKINTVKYQSSLKWSCQIRCTSIHIQTYCKIASVKTIESKIVKDHHYGTKRLVWITTAVGLASYQWWNTSDISHECIFRKLYMYIYIRTIYIHTRRYM